MPNDTIPEWAREMAAEAHQMLVASVEPNIETIAIALVEAERRGLERAAKRCDQFAATGRKLWSEDADERSDLHLAQAAAMASERTIVFHGTSFAVGLIGASVELGALPWWWLVLAAAVIPLDFFWQRWVAGRKPLAAAKDGE